MIPELSPKQVFESCCIIPDPERRIGQLSGYHIARLLHHCDSLPATGVPGLIRGLAENRAVELFRKQNPFPSLTPTEGTGPSESPVPHDDAAPRGSVDGRSRTFFEPAACPATHPFVQPLPPFPNP